MVFKAYYVKPRKHRFELGRFHQFLWDKMMVAHPISTSRAHGPP